MAIKNDFVVKHGLTVTNTATINQDLIVVGSIKKNGVDVGYGYTGSQGSIGYTGSQGIQGVTGYTGSQGIQGNIGYTGSQGNIGYTGSQGAQGIAGYTGSQGVIGYTGSKGDSGLGFTIAKTYASVAALTADTTPTGIVAGQFALIETGNVENPENSRLYLWNGSAYSYVSDLSGAQGITGPQGVIGYTGSQGVIGYTGSQGTQGVIGYTGSQGVIGYTGSQGIQGVIGYTGSAGPSNVLNATAASTSSVQYFVGVPATGSNQTPNASTTVPVVFQPSTGNVGIGATPSVPLEVRKSATGSNVIQRVGISGQTKNPYLESKFDETNGVVTLNASGSVAPGFTFEIAQSEKMRIDSNGNINIPTLGARITGDFSNSTLSSRVMFQTSTPNSPTSVGVLPNGTGDTANINLFASADSANAAFGQLVCNPTMVRLGALANGTAVPPPLTFYVNGSERLRIDTNGNLLVGKTVSTSFTNAAVTPKIQIADTSSAAAISVSRYTDTADAPARLVLSRSGSTTLGTDTIVPSQASIGTIEFQGFDGSTYSAKASILGLVDGVVSSGSLPTALVFRTGSTIAIERMRIDSNGNINIPTLGARITGDFSNPTVSNRLMFQSSTTNGNTLVGAVPNGTAGSVGFYAFGGSDPSNVAYAGIASSNGVSNIVSGITGTGTYQPLIMTTGGAERMRIDANGKVGIGTNAPAAVLDVNGASASNIVAVAASDIDCSLGNYFTKTINGATTFTFSNVPASRAFSFVLAVTHTSGAITWPASVSWPNSTAPTLTTGKTHLFVFVTSDGGSTWRGNSSVNY